MSEQKSHSIRQLRSVLDGGPRLRLVLLFGSGAKDRLRADSDLDIGLLPADPAMTLADELALASRLSAATGREVDVVRLDRAPAIVRWEVARNHALVLAESSGNVASLHRACRSGARRHEAAPGRPASWGAAPARRDV